MLFPNPTSDYFNIQITENLNTANIKVSNMAGRVIFEQLGLDQEIFSFDTRVWGNGIYVIQVQVNGRFYTYKLVVVSSV